MVTLTDLEYKLSSLSHSEEAINEVEIFCAALEHTKGRMDLWNSTNAIVRRPIEHSEAVAHGFNKPDDLFCLLQGDLIRTEAAYFFGERVTGHPKYAVLNSSCDLVPGRSEYSALLRIAEIRKEDPEAKARLGLLLKFTRRDSMYIPPLQDDEEDVICNVMHFGGICQIRTADLLLAKRIASMSLVGWRIFASLARVVVARANPREIEIRRAIDGLQ